MMDYCRWCGVYTETLDMECEDCSKPGWLDRFHFDPEAEKGKQWRPVVELRSDLL